MFSKAGVVSIWLLIPVLSFAQVQDSVPRVFDSGTEISVPDSIQTKLVGESISPENILLQWLSADGYLYASIDSVKEKTFYIDRGCAFEFQQLNWNYFGAIDTVVTQNPRQRYSQEYLRNEIESRLIELAEDGFPFANSEIAKFDPDPENCSVAIEVYLRTGKKAEASDILFLGIQTNSQAYLSKISRFQPGQLVTSNYLQFLKTNLNSSELFNEVGEGQVFLREGEPVIVFDVQERSLNQFDGLIGYVPDAAGNGQVVGDVELSLWNVITQGNGFDLKYQRLRSETSQLNIGASQDWIGNIPVGVSAGFQLYQNDTTYQSRDLDLNGYYRLNPVFKLTGGIVFQTTTSGNNVTAVIEPDSKKRIARLGFEYSNLDRYDVPTKGSSVRLIFGIANKDIADDSSTAFTQNVLEFTARNYIPIFEKSVIATSLHGFLLESKRVTANDLIRFGGANSFRGYSEQQFRAARLFWGDIEYRFLMNNNSFLFGFGAAGGYHRPMLLTETNNDFQITDYLFSTGFGLSYQTRIGRLKFTYAISPEESIGNGKVHFGIRTEL